MNNYYEFSNLSNDKDAFEYFNSLSTNILNTYLNDTFNYIESYLEQFSYVFKTIFKGQDYDEFYYSCKSLIEELNDIKIILNILKDRNNK